MSLKHALPLFCILLGFILNSGCSKSKTRDFATFDNGLTDIEYWNKGILLKELGYDGMTWRPGNTAEFLPYLDIQALELYATYVVLEADMEGCPVPMEIVNEINALKERDAFVWLAIKGNTTDAIAQEAILKIADLAAAYGLRVALYPHTGFHLDTVETCLKFVRQVNQPHVGVTFNLCHFLKQNDESELGNTIRAAAPHLFLVSINGADSGDTRDMDWDQLIQPLGEGSFDTKQVMDLLDEVDYQGPVVLQCYNIKQPAKEHLSKSIAAWKAMNQ